VKQGDQNKDLALHKVCQTSIEGLRSWKAGKKISMLFAVPVVWKEPGNFMDFLSDESGRIQCKE
jgi:hypothetical protein